MALNHFVTATIKQAMKAGTNGALKTRSAGAQLGRGPSLGARLGGPMTGQAPPNGARPSRGCFALSVLCLGYVDLINDQFRRLVIFDHLQRVRETM